ncbi:phosphopyruvate hydratase [SAR202 cluster bacterium AD-804-J14_MRT_500m]|nr:phosphopyruvate hydratase [SAR202 cluster bacterium AD-804-J14_MRT_500m]
MTYVAKVQAREILDSRGTPTIEAQVTLTDGASATAAIPSGASAGRHEALELRDCDLRRYRGNGVLKAVDNVENRIAPAMIGLTASDQEHVDSVLLELDGTPNKSRLGANATLAVSLAVCKAAAVSNGCSLYQSIGCPSEFEMPVPMFNILNGGAHASNSTDVQEFMVLPAGLGSYREALRAGSEIYSALGDIIRRLRYSTTVGDEGGFALEGLTNRSALEMVVNAIERAGYRPGEECFIGIDVAASGLMRGGRYHFAKDGSDFVAETLIDCYQSWTRDFCLISIEDGMGEDDWDGWCALMKRLGGTVQIVGDDLYTTNNERLQHGLDLGASNAILLKVNQIGTLTETLSAFRMASNAGWGTIFSHRSGETEDTTIADLAVAFGAGQIKAGAPCRSERVAKYNRLLRIEEELGHDAKYAGMGPYKAIGCVT